MKTPDYPACDLSVAGLDAQLARAESLGFTLVRGTVPCLKKLIDPEHRHAEDARTEAEYDRLADAVYPGGPPRNPRSLVCPYEFGFDHARLWRTAAGELFATADPYDLELADLERLAVAERDLGLRVELRGMTMYAPGYTFMVLITRPGSSVRIDLGHRTPPNG
jgi:hypothetical protein